MCVCVYMSVCLFLSLFVCVYLSVSSLCLCHCVLSIEAHTDANIHIHTNIPTHSHAQFILLYFISGTVAMWMLIIYMYIMCVHSVYIYTVLHTMFIMYMHIDD